MNLLKPTNDYVFKRIFAQKKNSDILKGISNKLEEWLTFISNENLEEIKMIENEYVKKAEKELETLSGDDYERRLAYLREKAIRDEAAAIDGALTRGRQEGIQEGEKKKKSNFY